jgi:hypothetical protein
VLLVFLVKSCRDAQREQAFKDYVRNVGAFVGESENQSKNLFRLLDQGGQTPVELQNTVNGFASEAAQLVDRANGVDHPSEVDNAHRYLVETLEFRRDGLKAIAAALPTALGDRGQEAINGIAGDMQDFLASDVIYSQRFKPKLEDALKAQSLAGSERPPDSAFLPNVDWLIPTNVSDRISRIAAGGGGGTTGPIAPGLHGTGLGPVTVEPGGQTLQQGTASQIKIAPNLALNIQVMNQGENDEKNVTVRVTIRGGSSQPIVLEKKIADFPAGQTKTATVTLSSTPTPGQPVTIEVNVLPVPGEKNLTNNKATFQAVFVR